MKLTEYTDYTLRTLIYLGAHHGELVTIQQIADAYGLSKNHLMKIVHQLAVDGVVETTRGRSGGVRLTRAPGEIGLGAVIRDAEEDFGLVECFGNREVRCSLAPACRLKGIFQEALQAFFAVLDGYSLADVLDNPDLVRPLVTLQPR